MLQGMNELLGPIYYVFANAARTNACDYCCCVQETTDACTPYFREHSCMVSLLLEINLPVLVVEFVRVHNGIRV